MAIAPAHQFGQIIGDILETAVTPLLTEFAEQHGLYLDKKGERPCRAGKKCSWLDVNGNTHDLDYVLERGGTPREKGMPAAFIETAWRRYTKHSRNKAQEIQGAIIPLVETYRNAAPFQGAILAGEFTAGALTQLRSLGFTLLYFPYETVISVFKRFKIDARYDEGTSDSDLKKKVNSLKGLSNLRKRRLAKALLDENREGVATFIASLTAAVSRQIERIVVLPLHGIARDLNTIEEAIRFVENYAEGVKVEPFVRYEIQVRYNNGNLVEGTFRDKKSAIDFLRTYQPVLIKRP
jgi:hypothetical protein